MNRVQKIKEFWNQRAMQYGANQKATLGEIAVRYLEINEINRHLDHGKKILDVGCGNGYTTKIFAKNYKSKIFGIDYAPEMIEIAGGSYLMATPGEKARIVSRENLNEINPDVVIVKPCGYKIEQTLNELEMINKNVPLENWEAYKNNNMFIADGNAYFNRPGPRILDSLEILSYCLHPETFPEFLEKYGSSLVRLSKGLKVLSH